jgi:uncharacterized membrane protein YfcA
MLDLILASYLILTGLIIGVLSGFFGFGGGFILTPFLINIGASANIAVGTSVTQIFMSSTIASLRHKRLGSLNIKLGLIIAVVSIFGTELGAQAIEYLKESGVQHLNFIVSIAYVLILASISIYMLYESKKLGGGKISGKNGNLWIRIRRVKAPPLVSLSQLNSEPISLWIIILIGLIAGLLAGFLGAGGGFILVPLLIYVIGCKPPYAAGTCTFVMLLSCAYASLSHATKGNVNFLLATLIFIGSSLGLQVGISATKYVKETEFKAFFGLCVGFASLSVATKIFSEAFRSNLLGVISQIIIFSATSLVASLIIILAFKAKRQR